MGVCHDIKFEEMARLYRNIGCHMLVYPAILNNITGPLHWSLLQRSRANDNQLYVAVASVASGTSKTSWGWGHSQLTDPWAKVIAELDGNEDMIIKDIGKRKKNYVFNGFIKISLTNF